MKSKSLIAVADARVESKIYYVRGKKVMFDRDLAELYGVETKRLNEAVRRNKTRFPADFMFQLNRKEAEVWTPYLYEGVKMRSRIATASRSQFATLNKRNIKSPPYAFTEQGVAMLSSVLHSERAIQVNIAIMRTFTKIREMLLDNKDLREKLEILERNYNQNFKVIFDAIRELMSIKAATTPGPYNDKNVVTFRR